MCYHFFFSFQVSDAAMGVTVLQSSAWMVDGGLEVLMVVVGKVLAEVLLLLVMMDFFRELSVILVRYYS